MLGNEPRASITPERAGSVRVRSIDRLEKELVRERGISIADMSANRRNSRRRPDPPGHRQGQGANGVLHVSFDVDFLDPDDRTRVGTTVPGGATYREAHLVMELLHDSGLVRSLDIVELNPVSGRTRPHRALSPSNWSTACFGQQITDRPTPTNAIVPG